MGRIPRYVLLLEVCVRNEWIFETVNDCLNCCCCCCWNGQTILKYTHPSHADYAPTMAALCRIKEIADLINQKKREFDNFQELLALSRKIDPLIPVLDCFFSEKNTNLFNDSINVFQLTSSRFSLGFRGSQTDASRQRRYFSNAPWEKQSQRVLLSHVQWLFFTYSKERRYVLCSLLYFHRQFFTHSRGY